MPRRDGTGPQGIGQLTGRGMGSCQGESHHYGRGFRRSQRRNIDHNNRYAYRMNHSSKEALLIEKDNLEKRINNINETLNLSE